MPNLKKSFFLLFLSVVLGFSAVNAQGKTSKYTSFIPGERWLDNNGVHINAHGGGIVYYGNKYYWFGEHKGENSNAALVGVTCYSSEDLYNWKNEGIALTVEDKKSSPIVSGCVIERPKVIYNEKTKQFVMYFHLELKGKGYEAAYRGVAVSENPTGPYKFLKAGRVNPKKWPMDMTVGQMESSIKDTDFTEWWTPEWMQAIKDGLFVRRDFKGGQMSRDMTLFVDEDGTAYHIYSSEDNLTLQIAELTDDYLDYTGRYVRVEPAGHNEAPAIFKQDGKYYMITSGCTGWAPNAARLLTADNIWGPWTLHPNPAVGEDANLTFHSQSTYIVPVAGKKDAYIYMGDRWTPEIPIDGRYIWLPILFENGLPVLKWFDEWDLNIFEEATPDTKGPATYEGWELVWNDEFNYEGAPDSTIWTPEVGFLRNKEDQWYQHQNAVCSDGTLNIYGRLEKFRNPRYNPESKDWRSNREYVEYTSSSINTRGTKEFQYGRFEVRAKIPTATGSWPAIWTLGTSMPWPSNGEIDIMEFYQVYNTPHILANTAWGTDNRWDAKWNSVKTPFKYFTDKDPNWAEKFHVWRMDWDEEAIRLYLDDELLNETLLKDTYNGSIGEHKNGFMQPHYILLNLAIGGINGGIPDQSAFPLVYQVDYVRVYQKK